MKKILTVTGYAEIESQPDMIRFFMTYQHKCEDYKNLLEIATQDYQKIKYQIISLGFNEHALKTRSLRYDQIEEREYEKDGKYYPAFKGYRCIHEMYLDFDVEPSKLSCLLQLVSEYENVSIRITYRLKDENKLSEQLYVACVEDAKRKAEVLVQASNMRLKKIVSIDASNQNLGLESATYHEPRLMSANINITPETIKNSHSITMKWLMKKG